MEVLIMKKYREYKFKTYGSAKVKQKQMKKNYGYTPTIFEVTNKKTRRKRYVVVRPHGLVKL